MLGLYFSSKLDWGSYFIFIAKTASKKIGALIHSTKFLSPEVALYPYKYTIRSSMKYCFDLWAGTPNCYLELLDKLQKRIFRTVVTSLNPWLIIECSQLINIINIISITVVDVHLNWLNWFHFLVVEGDLLVYFDRLHDFSVTIPKCYKDVYVNSFFPRTARLWNSLPIECFFYL